MSENGVLELESNGHACFTRETTSSLWTFESGGCASFEITCTRSKQSFDTPTVLMGYLNVCFGRSDVLFAGVSEILHVRIHFMSLEGVARLLKLNSRTHAGTERGCERKAGEAYYSKHL